MDISDSHQDRTEDIVRLFKDTFTASEGAGEGELIAGLVTRMFASVPPDDIRVFSALENGALVGTIVFTRLSYSEDNRTVFLLSPVAVAPEAQGKGVGQALIKQGLTDLRAAGVDVVLTYGDINFYAKAGFAQISEEIARAPLPLDYPHGWLGQALIAGPLEPLRGASRCVEALNDPALW